MAIPAFKRPQRESKDVQGPVVKYARGKGIAARKTSGPGNRSFPDYTFFVPGGVVFFIEFKAPGKVPTANQAKIHRDLRAKGFEVYVVDNRDYGKTIVDLYL